MDYKVLADVLRPTYYIYNKSCTDIAWPTNAGLVVTHMPATEKEGYSKGFAGYIANRSFYSLNNNSLAFIITSSYKEEKARPFEIIDTFTATGFKFVDYIIWAKNKFIPTQGNKRLNNVFDFILMFSKGDNYHLDRESISHLRNKLDSDNDNEYLCPGNVWKIKIDDVEFIPPELIESIFKLANLLPNTLIVDPIMGNGTTLRVALRNIHSFWGCEIDKTKYEICKKTVKEITRL